MSPFDPPADRSGSSSLGLLERARELAESLKTASPRPLSPHDEALESGDKGDKREKALGNQGSRVSELSSLISLTVQDPEVAWRLEAMRGQVPTIGAIPFLVARDIQPAPGACQSCGDPLGVDQPYRCPPCVEAATLALRESWEVLVCKPADEARR
jgi:hypothetical protein